MTQLVLRMRAVGALLRFAAEEVTPAGETPNSEDRKQPEAVGPATLDLERQNQARRYARQKQSLMIVNLAISAILVAVVLLSGLSFGLRDTLVVDLGAAANWAPITAWKPILVAAYFGVLFLAVFVVDLPLSYYSGFVLPRRYGLSTQKLGGWLADLVKGLVLSLVFELVAVEVVYLLLAVSPGAWWLWTALAVLFVTVILSNLAPVLLLPLFYKLTPLPEGELRQRLLALAAQAGTKVRGAYEMHMSAKTTAGNAAVMGLGNTRRIVIGDTMLDRYTPEEIEVVLAHELGHQVHNDIPKLIAVQSAVTLLALYFANVVLHLVVAVVPAYTSLADVATMPLLGAVLGVFSLLMLPIGNGFSRHVEHQADVYALQLTGDAPSFISAMTRLANQNLAELQPSPIVEFLLYDHPSTGRRLAFGKRWLEQHPSATAS